ncbi:MAG: hypothetical protein HXX13_01740 [Bacteroidetes bacterium]|nr:hypothetical protein [Bacteroidota bacterium]
MRKVSDTDHVYNRLKNFSSQRRITRVIFPLVFKPNLPVATGSAPSPGKTTRKETLVEFEGKTIRKITVITMDPFGFDVNDSLRKPHGFLTSFGNNLHVKSLPIAIRNYLLIRRNEPFDSLLVRESERLVRKQNFIRDVAFQPVLISPDSVDIIIRVQDVWSIVPDGSFSPRSFSFRITEDNFLGTGNQLKYFGDHSIKSNDRGYGLGYVIPNIDNSYITTSILYSVSPDKSYSKSIILNRTFFSPYTRWAGGILLQQQYRKDSLILTKEYRKLQIYKTNLYDYWAGTSWQILKGRSENERNTNLVLAGRVKQLRYPLRPDEIIDSIDTYHAVSSYLASIGINSRKYVRDKYLFRYGIPEDIPIGRVYSFTLGYQIERGIKTGYAGFTSKWSDFYSFGYLGGHLEYGTFFSSSGVHEGVVLAGMTYFTNLTEVGTWKFRQFLKTEMVIGMNRTAQDKLSFNDYMGVNGFDGSLEPGTSKVHFTIQTQSYAPWNLLGFRLGPFLNCTAGMLGDNTHVFLKSRLYSYIGIGVLIKNDYLNSNYFQLSLAYYPMIPALGNNILKTNSFQPSDFRLQDFEQGKPNFVPYE